MRSLVARVRCEDGSLSEDKPRIGNAAERFMMSGSRCSLTRPVVEANVADMDDFQLILEDCIASCLDKNLLANDIGVCIPEPLNWSQK